MRKYSIFDRFMFFYFILAISTIDSYNNEMFFTYTLQHDITSVLYKKIHEERITGE